MFLRKTIVLLLMVPVLSMTFGIAEFGVERIMFKLVTQHLQQGKVSKVEAEIYYSSLEGKLLTRFIEPVEQLAVTNRFGEISIYNESEQTVYRAQSQEYSSENHMLYFFLQGKTRDLGLRELGFRQTSTEISDDLVISFWEAPSSVRHHISKVELVHQDFVPVYSAYYNAEGDVVRKVYYTGYEDFLHIRLPLSITEFNYLPDGDSIVSRMRLSDVLINQEARSSWFEFEIPPNARIIE